MGTLGKRWNLGFLRKPARGTEDERFEKRVNRADANGCWIWTGAKTTHGYGTFSPSHEKYMGRLPGRHAVYAHRYSYERAKGPIPEGLVIDHLCRNPSCVNPDHLEPVTQKVNANRGAMVRGTHCRNGHPWSENLRLGSGKHRGGWCRLCANEKQRRYKAARRQRNGKLSGNPSVGEPVR